MGGEMIEKMDTETLLFIDESKNIDHEIDMKNYKWVTSCGNDVYNDFPFKKWQLKNFFYEISYEAESLFLGLQQDKVIDRLMFSVCKILRCINQIKPENSDELIHNSMYNGKMFKWVRNLGMLGISLEKVSPKTKVKKKYQDISEIGSESQISNVKF